MSTGLIHHYIPLDLPHLILMVGPIAMTKLLVCRVCVNEVDSQDKSYSIFENYEDMETPSTSRADISIAEKLAVCADVTIKKDDGLPNKICSTCLLQLEDAYKFRKKCEKSDRILRNAPRAKADISYHEVSVKVESEHISDSNVSDDDSKPLQTLRSENIKLKCEESPSIEYITPDSINERQTPEVISTVDNTSVRMKSKTAKLECLVCGLIFKTKSLLSGHRRTEHLPITCQSCKLQFKSFLAYQKHQINRPKTCINLSNLRIEGVGDARHFYCKDCEYSSRNVNNAIHHLVVHTKKCQYQCDLCERSFLRVVTLRAHKERTHKHFYGEKTCHVCGMFFRGFTLYDSHMRRHREKNKAHCDVCNKTFASQSSLYTHKKTHSELRLFACDKCPAKFRTSAVLNSHKGVHSEVTVACKICGYTVKNPYVVKKHEKEHDHTNVACRICGKFFDSDTQLEAHMKLHDDRGHLCGYCGKTYNARKILTEHLRKTHQIYVSTNDLKGIDTKKIKKGIKTNKQL